MRNRSRQVHLSAVHSRLFVETKSPWGNNVYVDFSGFSDLWRLDTMKDQVNPGYFRAEREGKILPVGPCESKRTFWECIPFTTNAKVWNPNIEGVTEAIAYGVPHRDYILQCLGLPVASPTVNSEVLLQEALARAQSDAWDTGTFLAELGKTIEGLTTLHSRLARLYQRLFSKAEHRAQSRAISFADAVSEVWLELRYQWRPLVYDIQDAQVALQRYRDGIEGPLCRGWSTSRGGPTTGGTFISRANCAVGGGSSAEIFPDGMVATGGSGMEFIQQTALSKAISVEGRATVGVQVTTRVSTMLDPVVTAWELVPWSFVLDWFITLGDLITAFSPFATGHFKYATYSEKTTVVCDVRTTTQVRGLYGPIMEQSITPGSLTFTEVTYSRKQRIVTPALGFNVQLDASKVADLVALAWGKKLKFIRRIAGNPVRPARFPRGTPL